MVGCGGRTVAFAAPLLLAFAVLMGTSPMGKAINIPPVWNCKAASGTFALGDHGCVLGGEEIAIPAGKMLTILGHGTGLEAARTINANFTSRHFKVNGILNLVNIRLINGKLPGKNVCSQFSSCKYDCSTCTGGEPRSCPNGRKCKQYGGSCYYLDCCNRCQNYICEGDRGSSITVESKGILTAINVDFDNNEQFCHTTDEPIVTAGGITRILNGGGRNVSTNINGGETYLKCNFNMLNEGGEICKKMGLGYSGCNTANNNCASSSGGGSNGGGDNPATNANNRPFPARLVVEGIAIFAGVIALVYVVKKIKYEWEQMKNLSSSSSKAKKQHGIDDGRSYALLNEGGGGENDEVVRRDSIIEMRSEQTAINEE